MLPAAVPQEGHLLWKMLSLTNRLSGGVSGSHPDRSPTPSSWLQHPPTGKAHISDFIRGARFSNSVVHCALFFALSYTCTEELLFTREGHSEEAALRNHSHTRQWVISQVTSPLRAPTVLRANAGLHSDLRPDVFSSPLPLGPHLPLPLPVTHWPPCCTCCLSLCLEQPPQSVPRSLRPRVTGSGKLCLTTPHVTAIPTLSHLPRFVLMTHHTADSVSGLWFSSFSSVVANQQQWHLGPCWKHKF